MRSRLTLPLCVVTAAISLSYAPLAAAYGVGGPAARWAYYQVDEAKMIGGVEGSLRAAGDNGWELVAVGGGAPYVVPGQNVVRTSPRTFYFKKQK